MHDALSWRNVQNAYGEDGAQDNPGIDFVSHGCGILRAAIRDVKKKPGDEPRLFLSLFK
jgi:hypothetical protein